VAELLADCSPDLVHAVGDHSAHADVTVERRGPFRPPTLVAVAARL
jgi:hypothetical protein